MPGSAGCPTMWSGSGRYSPWALPAPCWPSVEVEGVEARLLDGERMLAGAADLAAGVGLIGEGGGSVATIVVADDGGVPPHCRRRSSCTGPR